MLPVSIAASRMAARGAFTAYSRSSMQLLVRPAMSQAKGEAYLQDQKNRGRPLSPHLSIYKPQATSMLSITHRVSGAALSVSVWGIGVGALVLKGSFPQYIEALHAMHISPVIIVPLKFLVASSFFYHYFNGMRHLAWDMALGFSIKEIYSTGAIVSAISLLCGLYATFAL